MRVFVTGGTGLIGRDLVPSLLARGDEVLCVSRDPGRARRVLPAAVEIIGADPGLPGVWQDRLLTCDAVINLAGEPVAGGRWTRRRKQRLRRSRLTVTEGIVRALAGHDRQLVLVSGSAVGYYGDRGAAALGEREQPGQDFLARLAVEWEHAARKAQTEKVRVVLLRTGIVLAAGGGALPRLAAPFRLGFGGPLASGRQYFPWVHIDDLVAIILFALDHPEIVGAVNAAVPDPPLQREFAAALGSVLGKRSWLPAPRAALSLLLGEQAAMLLASQRAVPKVLKTHGFRFRWTDAAAAVGDLVGPEIGPEIAPESGPATGAEAEGKPLI